jgi:hypothetical protein
MAVYYWQLLPSAFRISILNILYCGLFPIIKAEYTYVDPQAQERVDAMQGLKCRIKP